MTTIEDEAAASRYAEATEYHCPHCGAKGLLREPGEGDYYLGPDHWCKACKARCFLP